MLVISSKAAVISFTPAGTCRWIAYISFKSRCHSISLPPPWMCNPVMFMIGPEGRWLPGTHSGYARVNGPGDAGIVNLEWKKLRAGSVASMSTRIADLCEVCPSRVMLQHNRKKAKAMRRMCVLSG